MKTLLALALTLLLAGCTVTGSLDYQDPKNPALGGHIGISKSFDGKSVKPLR